MKLIALLILVLTIFGSHASEAACSKKYAENTYWKLKSMPIQDKSMHCTLSCDLTMKCSSALSLGLGIAKEIYDMFGPGNAEMADLRADIRGVRMAKHGEARNFNQCLNACKALYEPK